MQRPFIPQEISRQALGPGKQVELTLRQKAAYFYKEVFLAVTGLMFLYFSVNLKLDGKDGAIYFLFLAVFFGGIGVISLRNKIKALRFVQFDTSLSPVQFKKVINEIIADSIEVEYDMSENTFIMYTYEGPGTPGEVVSVVYDNRSVYVSSIYYPSFRTDFPVGLHNNRNIRVVENSIREEEKALRIADIHRKALREHRRLNADNI